MRDDGLIDADLIQALSRRRLAHVDECRIRARFCKQLERDKTIKDDNVRAANQTQALAGYQVRIAWAGAHQPDFSNHATSIVASLSHRLQGERQGNSSAAVPTPFHVGWRIQLSHKVALT